MDWEMGAHVKVRDSMSVFQGISPEKKELRGQKERTVNKRWRTEEGGKRN